MKTNSILITVALVVLLCQCKARKKTEVATKTVTIEYSEMYCGGAAPPDELLSDMGKLKLYADKKVEVFIGNPAYVKPKKYKTNSQGQIVLPVNLADKVFINLYPSAEGFKSISDEYECYKKFIANNLLTVDLTSAEKEIKFIQVIQCNPCVPAAP